MSNIQII